MKIHVLGICGTFMGGLALLARELGHTVSGTDANTYPPMSLQLQQAGVRVLEGYAESNLDDRPDLVVIGNALSRGNPAVEYVLNSRLPYISGPQWLREEVLGHRHVLAVAGTHGKSTTSSMLAWILEFAGLQPGFLIGAVPRNFGVSARLGTGDGFVIEADEYDCAFFDKRAKFLHYRPNTLIINNIEFDHADIFVDLAAIRREFHYLMRTVPGSGRVICNGGDPEISKVLAMGCWTPVERFGTDDAQWQIAPSRPDYSGFTLQPAGAGKIEVTWELLGHHNALNAAAAVASAHALGVEPAVAGAALSRFHGVQRRMQQIGSRRGITVYDDFAHHPTAIRATLDALRRHVGGARIVAVMEPRSNTMKLGVHASDLAPSLRSADLAIILRPPNLAWDLEQALAGADTRCEVLDRIDDIITRVAGFARSGDHVIIMSNGGFGGIHQKLLDALQ